MPPRARGWVKKRQRLTYLNRRDQRDEEIERGRETEKGSKLAGVNCKVTGKKRPSSVPSRVLLLFGHMFTNLGI